MGLIVNFRENADDSLLKFAVIIAKHKGKWVFCKHKERNTYEIPGGHRECGESITETAARELTEETGAVQFQLYPVCVYSVTGKNRVNQTGEETYGMLYFAEIQTFAEELHSEMECVRLFDELPTEWTYPLIQPLLIEEYQRRCHASILEMITTEETMYLATKEAGELLRSKKLFIFDMDGTIYLGGNPFPFAIDFIKKLRRNGKRVLFFTNNASHSPEFYLNKLTRLGFEPTPDEILSSGNVTAAFLTRKRAGKTVYLLGTPELWEQFHAAGVNLICSRDGIPTADRADIVVTSFDTTLTYEKLTAACDFIRTGAEYLCTHPDFNCPTETGFIPDSGAIAACVTASTGVLPTYFGKPYRETVDMIEEITAEQRGDMCIFGDRLYTDIATGKNHGLLSVLVLTGETKEADVDAAEEASKPDILLQSLAEADTLMF